MKLILHALSISVVPFVAVEIKTSIIKLYPFTLRVYLHLLSKLSRYIFTLKFCDASFIFLKESLYSCNGKLVKSISIFCGKKLVKIQDSELFDWTLVVGSHEKDIDGENLKVAALENLSNNHT